MPPTARPPEKPLHCRAGQRHGASSDAQRPRHADALHAVPPPVLSERGGNGRGRRPHTLRKRPGRAGRRLCRQTGGHSLYGRSPARATHPCLGLAQTAGRFRSSSFPTSTSMPCTDGSARAGRRRGTPGPLQSELGCPARGHAPHRRPANPPRLNGSPPPAAGCRSSGPRLRTPRSLFRPSSKPSFH